jgi:hypothetical protein
MLGIFAVVESLPPDAVVSQIESDPNLLREYDLRTSAVKVLLVMREDYLPAVQARFPRVLRSSMRLAPLGVEQALKVIMRVSSDHVRPEAARRIVETLAVENRSGLPDREVDPPMLSLWMRGLEPKHDDCAPDARSPGAATNEASDHGLPSTPTLVFLDQALS